MERIPRQRETDIIKVVIYGPESTGKTTLSRQLAKYYNTKWVPEFARDYLQEKWDKEQKVCEPEDILPIAVGQMKLENEVLAEANKILICDTDILETKVYSEEFYDGFVPQGLDEAIENNHYDVYLLTYIDTPWVADDLRDRPNQRQEMFDAFENALKKHKQNYILMKGDKETRFNKAVKYIDALLHNR